MPLLALSLVQASLEQAEAVTPAQLCQKGHSALLGVLFIKVQAILLLDNHVTGTDVCFHNAGLLQHPAISLRTSIRIDLRLTKNKSHG
jgi:hypothetical protein